MILHIDMDAFYASIEERDRPELAGKPLIVGGTPEGRGVVAAANYVVRAFGVHSALPTATALRRCPHAIVVPPRLDHYAKVSAEIRDIFFRYTPLVEPLSLDEAFLDVTGSEGLFGPAIKIAATIKREIREAVGLVASVGVAPNKFLAKIASDLEKPDALVVVDPDRVQEFLDPLLVGRLWGVGRVTGRAFSRLGVQTIGQLRKLPVELLAEQFGQHGVHLWRLAQGIDDRPVIPDREAKSISHEMTFETDICEIETLRSWLLHLTEQVAHRLRRHHLHGTTVQIKVRYGDFHTITRAQTLPQPTHSTQVLWESASRLLTERLPNRPLRIRLLGIGVSGFDAKGGRALSLFPDEEWETQARIDAVVDGIRERFGRDHLSRGSDLNRDRKHGPPQLPPTSR